MASENRKLDELLDNALAEYSNVEPRAGLEGRILANLSTAGVEPERFSFLRFWPQWAVACAIVFGILALTVWKTKPAPQQIAKEETVKVVPRVIVPSPTPGVPTKKVVKPPVPTQRPQQPAMPTPEAAPQQVAVVKQPVFPAPSPLSDQERLLFSYMRRTDRAEIAANAKPDVVPALQQQINEQQINQVLPGQNSNTNTR